MHEVPQDLGPEVIAAHEAGHAIAVIVFGGTFTGILIAQDGNAVAQTLDVSGLTDLGYARSFLGGTAGEEVALGKADPRNAAMDQALMMKAIKDFRVLGSASPRAKDVILKYKPAHDAVRQLILDALANGASELIPADQVIAVAAAHGATPGAEEHGTSERD